MAAAIASLTYCILALVLLPNTVTEATITRNTSEAIRPYSMAVAPDWSRQKRFRRDRAARPPAGRPLAASDNP